MSVYYLLIGNKEKRTTIGSYIDQSLGGTIQEFNIIKSKGDSLLGSYTEIENQTIDKEIDNFVIYYTLKKNNIFYYVAVPQKFEETFNSNVVFNLIQDLENQKIYNFTDQNGNLTNSAQQNLKMIIQNYSEHEISPHTLGNAQTVSNLIESAQKNDVQLKKIDSPKESSEDLQPKEDEDDDKDKNESVLNINPYDNPVRIRYNETLKKVRIAQLFIYAIAGVIGFFTFFWVVNLFY
jgi:hypothetical protein